MNSKKAIEKNCIVDLYYRYSSEQNQLNNLLSTEKISSWLHTSTFPFYK